MNQDSAGVTIEFRDVRRTFRAVGLVIDRLNLVIKSGEFISFLGPSGCGKSTALRLMAGLDQPEAGEVRIGAQDVSRGFVFQDSHLLPWKSVLDNVALPMLLMKESIEKSRQMAHEALGQVGLEDAVEMYPNQLSGGMKMRVSVARALVTRPKLLLLDEPFAALDEITRHKLQDDLRRLWAEHRMTVVFVTHSVSEAVYLSDRVVVFSKRPARIVLDRALALPRDRVPKLRTDHHFSQELETIGTEFLRGLE